MSLGILSIHTKTIEPIKSPEVFLSTFFPMFCERCFKFLLPEFLRLVMARIVSHKLSKHLLINIRKFFFWEIKGCYLLMTKVIRWDSPRAIRMGLNAFDIDAEMYQNQKEQHFDSKRQNQRIFFLVWFLILHRIKSTRN